MARRPSLRRWQQEALELFESSARRDFLAVATPGAGKTTFALSACVRAIEAELASRVVVVAPTLHLKHQWADAAEHFGLVLDPEWSTAAGRLPRDVHGVVLTYQQVARSPEALRPLARGAFAILDEIHHAAETRAWGDGLRLALGGAQRRLCISGTPFRSDQNAIPFVAYRGEQAEPDFEYGYRDALADRRVVRPVYFPRIGGRMEWRSPDGTVRAHGFDEAIGRVLASQRLRTALALEGDWLPAVLRRAHEKLVEVRERDPRAAAMVIAMDQEHARGIAKLMADELGVSAVVATSDDPTASRRIAAFARSSAPWIVAVRMVSEGVDIPRLRVGVYATHTVTDLFFRQAVGRLVRFTAGLADQSAYMFIPDDARLGGFAQGIARQRRHSLAKESADPEAFEADEQARRDDEERPEQLSLFSFISAVPLDPAGGPVDPAQTASEGSPSAIDDEAAIDDDPVGESERPEIPTLSERFRLRDRRVAHDRSPDGIDPERAARSPRALRQELRERNLDRAKRLSRLTRLSHAEVNAELNRRVGIRKISEASLRELEHRLRAADAWIERQASRSAGPPSTR